MDKKNWIDEEDLLKSLDALEKAAEDDEGSDEEQEVVKGKKPKGAGDEDSGMPDDQSDADGGDGEEDDGEEMSSNEASEESSPAPVKKSKKGVKKSMGDRVSENEDLRKSVEVSSFLEGLVETTTDSVDSLSKALDALEENVNDQLGRQAHALKIIGRTLISIQKSLGEQDENAPVHRPRSNLSKSVPVERFESGEDAPEFTAKQTMDVLIDLASTGKVPAVAVSAYEATGHIEPQFAPLVEQSLRKSFGGNRS